MTEKDAKSQWLKNRFGWLTQFFGPHITEVEKLSSGKLAVTLSLSHLAPEDQSEIIMGHARMLKEHPTLKHEIYCMVFV